MPRQTPDGAGPLAHVRVLDFTALVQGPMATQMLGDLGADIIKFEKLGGEWSRHWGIGGGRTHGELDSFLAFNRNKRSVEIDLKDPAQRERVLALVADADVVVENFRPGVMDRLGLGYEALRERNPSIIYACSSGWGQDGPYRMRPGQDMLAQAAAGLMFLQGQHDDPPIGCGVGIADLYTGLHIVVGILVALAHRERTGEGQRVEVDLFSCTAAVQQQELTYYLSHRSLPPRPNRNMVSIFANAPYGVYATSDGHVAIAMTPLPVLAEAIDLPEVARFDSIESSLEHRDALYDLIAARLATLSTAECLERLLAHDVWCAAVQDYEGLLEDAQFTHNDLLWDVPVGEDGHESGDGTTFQTIGSPFTFSGTPARVHRGVPRLGEHTDEVMGMGTEAANVARSR